MLVGNLKGAAGGWFISLMSRSDGGNRLKGVDSEVNAVVGVGGLIAASFCCGAEALGDFSPEICNSLTLLSWTFGSVAADPNNGDVSKEKTGGTDKAAG